MPQSSGAIIGHRRLLDFLDRAHGAGQLAHAYLFVGPERVGKTTVAEWLLSQVVGKEGLAHPDVSVLGRLTDEKTGKVKSTINVEQVGELRERLSMSSFLGGWKAAFIEEADQLGGAAANALLKTLEEPSPRTLLILRATSPTSVLPTIASRCQVLRFAPVSRAEIISMLRTKGCPTAEAEELAGMAAGRPGLALRLLQDSQELALEETAIEQVLRLAHAGTAERMRMAGELLPKDDVNRKEAMTEMLDRWEWLLRDLLLAHVGADELMTRARHREALGMAARGKPRETWIRAVTRLREVRRDIAGNVNPTLALEHLVLSFS